MVDGPITSVKWFTLSSSVAGELFAESRDIFKCFFMFPGKEDLDLLGNCHLLVASAVEMGLVFM